MDEIFIFRNSVMPGYQLVEKNENVAKRDFFDCVSFRSGLNFIQKKGMKAIEIESKTDKAGNLKFIYKLNVADRKVRVLILVDDIEYENQEEREWLGSVSRNPAFTFLNEPEEDIYSKNDGKPLNA